MFSTFSFTDPPPRQAKLTNLAIQIGYGGMAISLITVIILCVRFSVDEFYYRVSFNLLLTFLILSILFQSPISRSKSGTFPS